MLRVSLNASVVTGAECGWHLWVDVEGVKTCIVCCGRVNVDVVEGQTRHSSDVNMLFGFMTSSTLTHLPVSTPRKLLRNSDDYKECGPVPWTS